MAKRIGSLCVVCVLGAGCDITAPLRGPVYSIEEPVGGWTFHWPVDRLPVRYFVAPETGPLARLVLDGIEGWERQLLYGEYQATLVTDTAVADVLVSLIGAPPPDIPLSDAPPEIRACEGKTSVDSLSADNRIVGPLRIVITLNNQFSDIDVVNCLGRVAAHEIGHSIGLFGHSPDSLDLMNGTPRVREPSAADRAAVQVAYHTPADLLPPVRQP